VGLDCRAGTARRWMRMAGGARPTRNLFTLGKRVAQSSNPILKANLVIPRELRAQIEAKGPAAYPNECCGMMIGRDVTENGMMRRVVDRLEAGANVFEASEQYHRFSIDPTQQLKVERAAETEGKVLLGYYHSHPDHPARPSEYDRQHAWPYY